MESGPQRTFFSVSKSEKIGLIAFAMIAAYVLWHVIPLTKLNPAHKQAEIEYAGFHGKLQLGMTLAEVRETFDDLKPKHIELHGDGNDVFVITPFQISARNWRMILEFKDDRLTRVHSQIVDYDAFPEGAPPDKVAQP